MAGFSANCTTMTIAGVDFASISGIQTGTLTVTQGCCSDGGTPVVLKVYPVDGTEDVTVNADNEVVLHAGNLGLGVEGDTIPDGIWNVRATYSYTSGEDTITKYDDTCLLSVCTLRCQMVNAIKGYFIDGDLDYTERQIRKMMDLYDALINGAIPCEKCNTACEIYSELYKLFNNTDCKCRS